MAQFYNIQEGLEKVLELSKDKTKPVIVSIHAPRPNSGKTHFLKEAIRHLSQKGYAAFGCGDYRERGDYEKFRESDFFFVDTGGPTGAIMPEVDKRIISEYTQEHGGKGVDIQVFIFNPNLVSLSESGIEKLALYDVVISNPNSEIKNI